MKRNVLFFIGLIVSAFQLTAQTTQLQLHVTDEKNESFNNSTAILYHLPDSSIVIKKVIKSTSEFDVEKQSSYYLKISATGKQLFTITVNIKDSILFLPITLKNKIADLSAVTIVSKKPLIKEEDDKTIVDAAALTISSTNAFEVIEKTPGAIIDQDGNIYLASTSPATVFINGREMKLSSSDLTSLLKSLPANSVSKIEILRNPSAKYDAASSGGIINIVLKKGVKLGNNGSVNAAYFQGVYSTKTAGFTFNKSGEKLTSYISYQYTNKKSFEKVNSSRRFLSDSILMMQQSFTRYPATTHYIGAGLDYAFNKKWNVGYDLRLTSTKNNNTAKNYIDISYEQSGMMFGENQSVIKNNNHSVYLSNSINLKCKIDTTGSEWTNNIEYTYFNYNNNQLYQNSFSLPAKPMVLGDGITDNVKNNLAVQSDLVLKFPSKYTFETGIKISSSNSKNVANYFIDTGNQVRRDDPFQTNTYQYKESVSAAYVQLSKTFHGFTIKPGLRFEITNINGRQIVPKDTMFSINRNDLFPYVFLKHKLFKMYKQTLMASAIFRKTIKRPYYESLNPYPKYVDQYLYEAGNPSLKPQFTTNYELNVTFNDIPVVSFGFNNTKDIFSSVIYQDNNTKIAYRTFDNLGKNKEFYSRIVAGIPPGGKYFFYIGGVFNYNEYRGFYQSLPFNYNRSSFTCFTFHEYKATKTFSFNLQGFLRTKGLQNFYELSNFGGVFVSMNKSILKKKANIILSASDIFSTNHVSFSYIRDNQNINGERINDTRRIGITMRYNFGMKPKEEKKNGFDTPQEVKE